MSDLRQDIEWLEAMYNIPDDPPDGFAPGSMLSVLAAARRLLEAPEQTCEQCEGGGEVLPHGDVDCEVCVRGEYEGHTIECPTCGGLGAVLAAKLLVDPQEGDG